MITFLLYIATAISTAWQLSQQILMGVWGKPSNPFEFIGFLGSIILLASAYVALFSLRRATWIAIAASVLLWIFYVPAFISSIGGIISGQYIIEPFVFVPTLLLVGTTSLSIMSALNLRRQKTSDLILFRKSSKIFAMQQSQRQGF